MAKDPVKEDKATAPAKKKESAKKAPKVESVKVDVELIGRIPTADKYGYDEVRVTVKDVPTKDMHETVRSLQRDFDRSLVQTRKFHSKKMELDEVIDYLS